jgi:hypothetical protein
MERAEELQHWSAAERRESAEVVEGGAELTVRDRRIASSELNDIVRGAASSGRLAALRLSGCAVDGALDFSAITVGELELTSTMVRGPLDVRRATFEEDVRLDGATVDGAVYFWRCEFQGPVLLSGPLINGRLTFAEVTFRRHALMQCTAKSVSLFQTRFEEGADLLLRHAVVLAEHVAFGAPSLIADSNHGGPPDEHLRRTDDQRPRIESLRRSDVGTLLLSNVDLGGCRFYGAHGLDQLRIDGDPTYATEPATGRWTPRRILAEEADVRVRAGESEWQSARTSPTDPSQWRGERPLDFGDVAALYRALRKGQEERKDEPGAADFYYGEMEMRRRAASGVERKLLWLYWVVSGYGLRASRALAALAVTIIAFGLAYHVVGFDPEAPLYRAGLFSLESTSSLFRTPPTPGLALTPWGEILHVVERLLGPLFFALIVLSLRGRVKR